MQEADQYCNKLRIMQHPGAHLGSEGLQAILVHQLGQCRRQQRWLAAAGLLAAGRWCICLLSLLLRLLRLLLLLLLLLLLPLVPVCPAQEDLQLGRLGSRLAHTLDVLQSRQRRRLRQRLYQLAPHPGLDAGGVHLHQL